MAETLKNIPIELIQFNDNNLRTDFTEIEELADSIAFMGIIEPPVVVKEGDLFILVAGERRVRACERLIQRGDWEAGASIKCIVRSKMTEEQQTSAILIENMQRVNLSAVEQANGVVALAVEYGMTEAEIAKNLGVTKQWVKDRIGIHGLPEELKPHIGEKGGVPVTHAGMLAGLPEDRVARLTKDGKVPSPYDIESQVQKVASEKKGEQLYKRLLKSGVLVVTEKSLKRIIASEMDELSGNDLMIKGLLGDANGIMDGYWSKSPDTKVKLEQLYKFDGEAATKSNIYVQRRVGGYTEWALAVVVPGEGKGNVDKEPDEYDLIDERNMAKEAAHRSACYAAELKYVEHTKPAELINAMLWATVMQVETGYQSFKRGIDVCERLGLEAEPFDLDASLEVQRAKHVETMNSIIAYAKKNAANLARAAITIEMVSGRHGFDVEYPDPPTLEDYPEVEEENDELVGF